MTTRERLIEAALSDYFDTEGFTVAEGYASLWVSDGMGGGEDIEINLARLALHLDREFDRIAGASK